VGAIRLDRGQLRLQLLDPGRDLAHRGDLLGGVGALALGGADRIGGLVAPGTQTLDFGQQLAAAGIELEQAVEVLGGADAGERRPGGRRVLADAP
jgi:hypothetical protein